MFPLNVRSEVLSHVCVEATHLTRVFLPVMFIHVAPQLHLVVSHVGTDLARVSDPLVYRLYVVL